MTIDELVKRVNDDWGWAYVAVLRDGSGQWVARFVYTLVFDEKREQIHPPVFRHKKASRALQELVAWYRGKVVKLQSIQAGTDGEPVRIPRTLMAGCGFRE